MVGTVQSVSMVHRVQSGTLHVATPASRTRSAVLANLQRQRAVHARQLGFLRVAFAHSTSAQAVSSKESAETVVSEAPDSCPESEKIKEQFKSRGAYSSERQSLRRH